jgi:signal transduction histidine kinase
MISDPSTINDRLTELELETPIQHVRIYRPDGTIVFSSTEIERGLNVFSMTGETSIFGDEATINSFTKNGDVYSHHHPLYVRDDCASCHENRGELIGILDVHARTPQSEQIYTYAKNLSVTGGVLIIVILILVTNLVYEGQIEHRLRSVLEGFDELADGSLDSTIDMSGEHELAQIADRFNSTVEKLKEAREKEDEFYREKLEHADRLVTLGEIAAEIAHEVNNPAGIILSRAELMRDDLDDSNGDAGYRDDLDIIVQQTERISDITRSILHYAHKRPISFAKTDLSARSAKPLCCSTCRKIQRPYGVAPANLNRYSAIF